MFLLFGLLAVCLAWLLPGHYPPWVSFEQQLVAAIGAGLVVAGAWASSRRQAATMPLSLLACAALVAALVPWVQLATGQVRFLQDALVSSSYLVAFALCTIGGAVWAKQNRQQFLVGLEAAVIAAGIVSMGLALVQWLELGPLAYVADMAPGGRPFANIAQPNQLCSLFALALLATLRAFEQGRMRGPVATLAAAWFGIGMVMTQSRTGWLLVAVFVVWFMLTCQRVGLKLSRLAVAGGAIAVVLGVLCWETVNRWLLLPIDALGERAQAAGRWVTWETLWDALMRKPWTGYGWTQVGMAQQAAILDHPAVNAWMANSHNIALDFLLWNGLPLGAVFIGVVVLWFWRQVRACRSVEQWLLLTSVGVLWVHGLLEYPLEFTYFLFPLGLMMGALDGFDSRSAVWRVPRAFFGAVLLVMFGLLGWIGIEYLEVQSASTRLRFVMSGIGVDKVPDAPVPDVVLLDSLREFHRYWQTPVKAGASEADLAWARDITLRYAGPPAMLRFALAAGLNGRPREAADTLARLCKMNVVMRCDEARDSWTKLQAQHPILSAVPLPPQRFAPARPVVPFP